MRLTRKTVVLAIALLAIITTSVFGTIAYLTDTAEVTNTFTIGKVDIKVDESIVDENGDPTEKTDDEGNIITRTEEGNEYHMIPGKEYTKDPTMTVLAGSEPAFYRMLVTLTDLNDLRAVFGERVNDDDYLSQFVTDLNSNLGDKERQWDRWGEPVVSEDGTTITFEFRYNAADQVDASGADVELAPLFTTLKIPGFFDNEDLVKLEDMEINIVGHAIQMAGFEDSVDENGEVTKWAEQHAWEAFDRQLADKNGGNGTDPDPEGGEGSDPEPDVDQGASED